MRHRALRTATAAVSVVALATLPVLPASAAESIDVPIVTSDNVELVDNVPKPGAIAGVFSPSAPYFYVSTVESIDVYDVRTRCTRCSPAPCRRRSLRTRP